MLDTPHNKENCTAKFLTVTQNCFLHQHVNNPTHVRPNQIPTLTDLCFTSDDQAINNMSFLSPLGKSHHNVIIFQCQLECVESSEVGFKSVFTKEKNALPDFEPVCETNISKLFFLKAKLKRNFLIWRQTPTAHNLPSRILKELSVRLSVPLRILYTVSFKQKLLQDWKNAMITLCKKKDEKCLASNYRLISLT